VSCQHCLQVKEDLLPWINSEFRDKLILEEYDIADIENYKLLLGIKKSKSATITINVPLFYLNGNFLEGSRVNKANLRYFILSSLADNFREELLKPPAVNLVGYFKSFSLLAVIGAGLIDGINPCAFTVIVFFISFLALQGYRKKELIVIGLSFICAVFITYLLIGVGIFNFLYRLEGFWLAARLIGISIGVFSIALGILCLSDFFRFRKTASSEGMFLQLPEVIKKRIRSVIGLHYRKTEEEKQEGVKPHILKLIASALVSGFLVSLLEAVCTGQVYLPTITFVLKTTSLKLEAWGQLLLYNLMFIIPLLMVFLCALFGVTSEGFAKFMKRHLGLIKILMAVLFFALGAFLIWSYDLLPAHAEQGFLEKEDASRVWHFGKVKQGEVLAHKFEFKNKTKGVLNIGNISTSCGCTVSEVGKKKLSPGESTQISVK
ncbi:MAG: DUF1573 domain-containing protein, partial [Candidatus Omnitrophota bacterium]|nr:DUF1573 domain-containing protein [Candidatus Omnitrophota bacterium]